MKYEVIHDFYDLQDVLKTQPKGRFYKVGDKYPATKRETTEERIEELLGENIHQISFIKKIGEKAE